MCDVCGNKSGGKDVGVAAVPSAPLSVMWCNNCLANNAVPKHVFEYWLCGDLDDSQIAELTIPDKYPLAGWSKQMTVFMDDKYITLEDCYKEILEKAKSEARNADS